MKALIKQKIDTAPFESDSTCSSSLDNSPECSRRFWMRPQDIVSEPSSPRTTEYSQNQEHTIYDDDINMINNELLAVASTTNNDTASKRHQTKLLLVSLIESLCQTYGDSTDATRQIFFLICQTLSTLGFIDAEFIDEVSSVRSTYHRAFEQLFYTAAQTVRQKQQRQEKSNAQERQQGAQPRLLTASEHDDADDEISPLKYTLNIQNSRYHNDFVEQGMLGRGGFASAWRARNKLDDIEYAIKKIRLLSNHEQEGYYDKIFREIKNLARLEHHNVVRYYSSWLEYASTLDHPQASDDDAEEEEDISWLSNPSQEDSRDSIFQGRDPTFEQNHATLEEMSFIRFGNDDAEDDDDSQSNNIFLYPSSSNSTVRKSSSPTKQEDKGDFVLFIQMQLCPSTLHEFIKIRNQNSKEYFDDQQNIDLFTQILEGAAYIHQQGLIHGDLKPSNIFLSRPASTTTRHNTECNDCCEALIPKIGDFGLAANALHDSDQEDHILTDEDNEDDSYLASTFESNSSVIELFAASTSPSSASSRHLHLNKRGSSSHSDSILSLYTASTIKQQRQKRPRMRRNQTSGVGTRTYAAPEQLASPCKSYDEKADIYSLGIILFELYNPFFSAMERAIAIDRLKRGIFPDGFAKRYPVVKELVSRMMHRDPCQRPSAEDVLNLAIFARNAIIHNTDNDAVAHHDKEMAEMRHQYTQMKQEKEDLQRRLDDLENRMNGCQIVVDEDHGHKRNHTCQEERRG